MQALEKTNPGIYRALSTISEMAENIEFMVIGGVAKLARGILTTPHDLDLVTDGKNLSALDGLLSDFRIAPPRLSDGEIFSGTLAKYGIGGVDVEISSEITLKVFSFDCTLVLDGALMAYAKKFCERPVFIPLEEQLIFDFLRRDKPEKAGLLFGYFKTNRPDFGFLKKRLDVHGIPPDIRMRLLAGLGLHE